MRTIMFLFLILLLGRSTSYSQDSKYNEIYVIQNDSRFTLLTEYDLPGSIHLKVFLDNETIRKEGENIYNVWVKYSYTPYISWNWDPFSKAKLQVQNVYKNYLIKKNRTYRKNYNDYYLRSFNSILKAGGNEDSVDIIIVPNTLIEFIYFKLFDNN